jgi:hypothetical protein
LPSRFKRYLAAVGVFGVGDFSHALLILAATALLTPSLGVVQAVQAAGLLYIWRNIIQVAASWPVDWLADRFGQFHDVGGRLCLGHRYRDPDGIGLLVAPREYHVAG